MKTVSGRISIILCPQLFRSAAKRGRMCYQNSKNHCRPYDFIWLEREGIQRRSHGAVRQVPSLRRGWTLARESAGAGRAAVGHADEQEQGLIGTVGGRGGGLGGSFWEVRQHRRIGQMVSAPQVVRWRQGRGAVAARRSTSAHCRSRGGKGGQEENPGGS